MTILRSGAAVAVTASLCCAGLVAHPRSALLFLGASVNQVPTPSPINRSAELKRKVGKKKPDLKKADPRKSPDVRGGSGQPTVAGGSDAVADIDVPPTSLSDDPDVAEQELLSMAGRGAAIRVNGELSQRIPAKANIISIRLRHTVGPDGAALTIVDIIASPGRIS